MIRTFSTHRIRKQQELTGQLWDFSPCSGEHAGQVYRVATPCCWESHPDFGSYRGEGSYSTTFLAGGNLRLEFKGVSHTARVYLDGQQIARHYNAYTPFSTIVRDVAPGEHRLTVVADNRFSDDSALHVPNDYMSYGGVSRPVVLEQLGKVYIKYMHITPFTREGSWHLGFEIVAENISDGAITADVHVEAAGLKHIWQDVSLAAGEDIALHAELDCSGIETECWSPEHPVLQMAEALIYVNGYPVDDLIDRFGFREITVEGKKILLNGQPMRIKGLCRHEDHPQFGCALPYAAMAADLEIIRHLGANSVRTSHYPNDEVFLDLCDEMGILVWEENHARGLSEQDMRNPNFQPQAEEVIREMILHHYNHPSMYIWGILNECSSDTEYGKECYRRQFELIRQLDSSRPHSFASCRVFSDICLGLPDVVSYNIYPHWYHDAPVEEYLNELYSWIQNKTEGQGKPFMITEVGAGGIYGYRNNYDSKWTEDYQAQTLRRQLTAILDHPDCMGVYIWQFCDVRVSEEWFGGRPRTMNNKGIVDEFRRRKLCYNVVKEIFHSHS